MICLTLPIFYDEYPITLEINGEGHYYNNYIAYLPNEPRDAEVVFSEIEDINNLHIVKDGYGNFYIPEWEWDGIGDMEVGQGYEVIMYEQDVLEYTVSKNKAKIASYNTVYFDFISPTCYSHPIIIENINIDDMQIEEGDELAAFTPDGLCCGGVICHGSFPLIFPAWKDDETTDEIDGYLPDQEILLRLWDKSSNRVISLDRNSDSWNDKRVPSFNDFPYSLVSIGSVDAPSKPSLPQIFKLFVNYPNPFNSYTYIKLDLQSTSHVKVNIFDQSGRNVRTILDCPLLAGRHAFSWDGTDDKSYPVNTGIYFCRVKTDDKSETIRMVLTK